MSRKEEEILFAASTRFSKMLMRVTDALCKYTVLDSRTSVQEAGYEGFVELMKKSLPLFWQYNKLIDEELYYKLIAYQYLLKRKAEEGDEHAIATYNKLAPVLEQVLMLQMDKD